MSLCSTFASTTGTDAFSSPSLPKRSAAVAFFARHAGFTDEHVAATVTGPRDAACWTADEQALIALVDDLVDRRAIAEATWTALSAHFDEKQILEAIALVGFYHTISFLCRGLELPLEDYSVRFP